MRRALGATLLVLAAASVPAAGGAPNASASLTLPVWVEYSGGTGAIASPAAFCDTGIVAAGALIRRRSDRIGQLTDPAWSRDGRHLVYVVPDPPPHTDQAQFFEADVTPGTQATIGRPRAILRTFFDGATMARSWDMTADAQRFLIVYETFPPAVTAPHEIASTPNSIASGNAMAPSL